MESARTAGFIAYKSVRRGRVGMFVLMMLILSLSFFNMLFIPGVFSGLFNTIVGLLIDTTTSHIVVSPIEEPTPKRFIDNEEALRARIETIPGVVATTRTYLTAASLSYDKHKDGIYKTVSGQIIGIDPSESERVLSLDRYLVAGKALEDGDTDQIVLSAGIAGGYDLPVPSDLGGIKVGDRVNMVYGNGVARTYTVKGIVKIVFGTALSSVYITSREAESVLSASDQASQILVRTDMGLHDADYYQTRVRSLAEGAKVQGYADLLAAIQPILAAFTLIATIVSGISVIIAAVTIFVMIYINAVNKRRQIGILKAIGIKEGIIVSSYVLQALFYVFCGVSVGVIFVFLILSPILAAHPIQLPFGPLLLSFSPRLVGESIALFFLAGLFSGYVPSRLVAREEILKAIWG
jgi:putative ABC transport system permease protein